MTIDALKKHSDVVDANKNRERPSIPELPKTRGELIGLLKQGLKVVWQGILLDEHGGEYHPGGVAVTDLEMECPFCGMKFWGVKRSGCFTQDTFPDTCPNCNFPENVYKALKEKHYASDA